MKTLKRLNPWILFLLFLSVSTAWGQPANFPLDFETGSLRGWQKTGNAFDHQPTLNDNPTARHRSQMSWTAEGAGNDIIVSDNLYSL
jgi:hypothetical protein